MVSPNQEADERNGQRGQCNGPVAENVFLGESRDHFRNDSETGYHHNVYRGVRIEPEEMLVQYRVAAKGRIKNPDAEHTLHR